ncbi:oxidoreductase [Catellatospora methionotrophica]|uniref:Oxidoreductase n=1 Tax=Catellatospora methionotrophica TaxID=121620 RepID=A0A8J3LSS2_9ACTN|nr:glucose 1-dehydrogenase [Catellatospora methionotrophica]GIG18210.1 oxidoreductase [Catellatospora methionotrophica]
MHDFQGKSVLITGGGSGIGLATAKRMLAAGANVALAGRSGERLASAAKVLDAGDRVLTVPTDVSRLAELDSLVESVRGRFGSLHGVFANAGVGTAGRVAQVTEDEFDRVVGINLKGTFFTVQRALPLLEDGGAVVLNSSWTAHRGLGIGSLYSATKAAVAALTGSLAADLAERGIRVNTITPGHVATEMFEGITGGSEQVREMFRSQVALGRLGDAADIAEAVYFLLSPQASYVTGQQFVVDGGLLGAVPSGPSPR